MSIDALIHAIKALSKRNPRVDDVLRVGKMVIEVGFDGDVDAFSSRSPHSRSLREFMEDPRIAALGIGRRTLADYARVYLQSLTFPEGARGLELGHRLKLLPLPAKEQGELALQAAVAGWSGPALAREVRRRLGPSRGSGAQRKARSKAIKAVGVLAELRFVDLTDGALTALATKLIPVLRNMADEAQRRGLDLGLDSGPPPRSPSAPGVTKGRKRYGDGSLVEAYRPRAFSEVVGQAEAVEELRVMARSRSKVPILLCGPPGAGKTTLARIYCRGLLCQGDRPDGCEPCDLCDMCKQTAKSSGIAMLGGINETSAAATGDAKQAAEDVLEDFNLPWDAHIVNEADRLLIQQQRLLTILEERKTVPIVFSTTDLKRFDAQFQSRCKVVRVKPITEAEMVQFLVEVAEAEVVMVSRKQIETFLQRMDRARASQARDVLNEFETFLRVLRDRGGGGGPGERGNLERSPRTSTPSPR